MSVKIQFLHLHLNNFPENLNRNSEKQGEHFHQN